MVTLQISSRSRNEFIDLTAMLREALAEHGWKDGALLVFNPHTTAGLTINEGADPDVRRDVLAALARLIPERGDYRHAEGNSDAHLKASLMGSSLTIPVVNGQLGLGTWQSIYFCEFDGPRNRKVNLSFLRSAPSHSSSSS
jgi:secondary thiamine-phosphate synthase enzyme